MRWRFLLVSLVATLSASCEARKPAIKAPSGVQLSMLDVAEGWDLEGVVPHAVYDKEHTIDEADVFVIPDKVEPTVQPRGHVHLIGFLGGRIFGPFNTAAPPRDCNGLQERGMIALSTYFAVEPNALQQTPETHRGDWYCVRTRNGTTSAVLFAGPDKLGLYEYPHYMLLSYRLD